MKNGKLLKELEPHLVEINMLAHSLALNIVVSCSIDNVIKIHDDSELTESEVKKELFIQNGQVKSIAICEKYARLAIGLSTGLIKFYDIEHFRYDSDLHSDDPNLKNFNAEVTCLAPLQGTEVIFCGNSKGDCKFMVIPPSQMKFEEISSFYNSHLDPKDNRVYNIPVTCCDYDMERQLMFTGDQVGYIKCYDIKPIFDFCENDQMITRKYTKSISIRDIQAHLGKIHVPLKWKVEAHKESLKHIHHVDIEPRIVIFTYKNFFC